jgi:hypothetical protein
VESVVQPTHADWRQTAALGIARARAPESPIELNDVTPAGDVAKSVPAQYVAESFVRHETDTDSAWGGEPQSAWLERDFLDRGRASAWEQPPTDGK